jgi:hypothetical protein
MMASLRKQPKGESWQLRVNLRKKPIVLSLSNLTEAQAERWKLFVQAIADRVELGKPLDRTILEWLSSLSSEQRKKLSDKGLIDPDEEEQPNSKEILLKDYLEEYFSSRKLDVKGSTWIFYQHTRKRLEEYFPGRSIQSITSIEAKQFRKWLEDSNKRDKHDQATDGALSSDIQAGDRGRLDRKESLRWDVNFGTVQQGAEALRRSRDVRQGPREGSQRSLAISFGSGKASGFPHS